MTFFSDPDTSLASFRQAPLEIAPDTFVIRAVHSAPNMSTNLNSMLILAKEPVVVDTGMVINREQWFEDLFSLVHPDEVRWIYVTHDDCDHTGNLVEALERCPRAMVVTNRAASWRTSAAFGIPEERIRTVANGETFSLGDRSFLAFRPPVFDSPYTLGLFDPRTRVYYASDAFCTPMPPSPVDRVDEISALMWAEGMAKYHQFSLCPWISIVDQDKFGVEVNKLAALGIKVIVGAHTPVISGNSVNEAYNLLSELPSVVSSPLSLDGVGVPVNS